MSDIDIGLQRFRNFKFYICGKKTQFLCLTDAKYMKLKTGNASVCKIHKRKKTGFCHDNISSTIFISYRKN